MFRKIGDGLRRFMAGRYGSDRLNQCLLGAALVLILISAFWGGTVDLAATNWLMVGIFLGAFLLLRKTKMNAIAVMVLAGMVNLVFRLVERGI